jgi:UDP-N-acetylmuramoyl-tripeptide--D-alanyl-D-alanine ligase
MLTPMTLFLVAAFAFFAGRRLARFLHIFQQDEYDATRFVPWLIRTLAFDRRMTACYVVVTLGAAAAHAPAAIATLLQAAVLLGVGWREPDPRREAKKKLVMTQRATRIYALAWLVAVAAGWAAIEAHPLLLVVVAQLLPLALVIGNGLLKPFEAVVQARIRRAARQRLAEVAPHVIGITGSFGKTSVKHILGHVLALNAPTLFTPGSVNTQMGIARIVREQLRDGCRFFLSEMGAYRKGSIAKLCALTPPDSGIITSLGAAHYERFKSLDAVAEAKFELAEAVIARGEGKIVVADSVLDQPRAKALVEARPDRFVLCGPSEGAAARILDIVQTIDGLSVRLTWQGETYELFAPLFGVQQAGNLALAFAAAALAGFAPARIVASLRTVPQIAHRLEVKEEADGCWLIDDAYNANPIGFRAGLQLLALLAAAKGGRRILVTPGMAELGAKHDDEHRALGTEAARQADIVLAIKPARMPTFIEACRAGGLTDGLYLCADLAEAQAWLRANRRKGDVILIENDLPDLYERNLKL